MLLRHMRGFGLDRFLSRLYGMVRFRANKRHKLVPNAVNVSNLASVANGQEFEG